MLLLPCLLAVAQLPFLVSPAAAAGQAPGTPPIVSSSGSRPRPGDRAARGTLEMRDVEWRLPVGCDFSGFFSEVVAGYLPFLLARGVPLKLLHGGCSEEFLRTMLPADGAAAYRRAQVSDERRPAAATAQSIVIEHAEPCKMRQWRNSSLRPRWVISRSMSEGTLPSDQAACLGKRADEVWVPTEYHRKTFTRSGVSSRVSD
eukprot:SAG22_NODE_5393_length_1022_cov_1.699892_2_plen_202_part_00